MIDTGCVIIEHSFSYHSRVSYLPLYTMEVLRNIPVLGKFIRIAELLASITAKLTRIQIKLLAAQSKARGSTEVAIILALTSVGSALVALYAATADPEPVTKIGLCIAAVTAVVTAIAAITKAIDAMKADKDADQMKSEIDSLEVQQNELNEELRKLRKELGI